MGAWRLAAGRPFALLLGLHQLARGVTAQAPANHAAVQGLVRTPVFFDCSNHQEWSEFRLRFTEFRRAFTSLPKDSPELIDLVTALLYEANNIGHRHEGIFVKWVSSWDVFLLCRDETRARVAEELQRDFCFYGFIVVQWLGLFGYQHFSSVPGMADWARNARAFLLDASKFNGMHFLESSGWPVKLVEMARALSSSSSGHLPIDAAELTENLGQARQSPSHSRLPPVKRLQAVAISYHLALLREPLSLWQNLLQHRFEVETTIHVLDATARTVEDVERLHSHCRFAGGAWCETDPRLLRLNELFDSVGLDCHSGDHKTRHHFIRDAEAYHELFLELMGREERLQAADLLICGEPVFFCRLLAHFGKPVLGYISTPLSVYINAADRPRWYEAFYQLAMDPLHTFAVTTPIFGEWITYATGVDLPVVRPVCTYTMATYFPTRSREVLLLRTVSHFWDTACILNFFAQEALALGAAGGNATVAGAEPLQFVESESLSARERVGYSAYAEFLAAVIYPYAFSQFWFYELYAMGVPIFMPARETLPLFVNQDYAACPDFDGHRPGHRPESVHEYSPFDTQDWEAMTYWTAYTDYMRLPAIEHFVSVPELVFRLESGDHRRQSQRMLQAHAEHMGAATSFWLDTLQRVVKHAASPPEK